MLDEKLQNIISVKPLYPNQFQALIGHLCNIPVPNWDQGGAHTALSAHALVESHIICKPNKVVAILCMLSAKWIKDLPHLQQCGVPQPVKKKPCGRKAQALWRKGLFGSRRMSLTNR
jgi:hypothetical protein